MINDDSKFKFQVEIKNVLDIIAKEIYDSPYALLRENIQNAYDAILMRKQISSDSWNLDNGHIIINIVNNTLTIQDNGIGMTENTLKENYWKAGSSGKKSKIAQEAGVIGSFGIGAMANFGVCNKLTVETKYFESPTTLISEVEKENLSLSEDCISLKPIDDNREPGTKINVELETNKAISSSDALKYLEQYVKYLPINITLNGEIIGKQDYKEQLLDTGKCIFKNTNNITNGFYSFDINLYIEKSGDISIEIYNIKFSNVHINGDIVLKQGKVNVEGLRNFFGLAPVPVSGFYRLGGVANLFILQPTAGREALSRESINHVNQIIALAEEYISQIIAQTEYANKNSLFLNYIYNKGRYDLASLIKVDIKPDNLEVAMNEITNKFREFSIYYYTGRDESIIDVFSSEGKKLIIVSQSSPRQKIQIELLKRLGVKEVPDVITISKIYANQDLSDNEFSLLFRLNKVLEEDYFLKDVKVCFSDISHNIPYKIEKTEDTLNIYLARNHVMIKPLLGCYETDMVVFTPLVKDFVRINLYPHFAQFVPTSSKQGLDALRKILLSKKEAFEIKYEEQGKLDLELDLEKYRKGEISLETVLDTAKKTATVHKQEVYSDQVGKIENLIPEIVNNQSIINASQGTQTQVISGNEYLPMPAIEKSNTDTHNMKILTVDTGIPLLNDFIMFLSLTDRVYDLKMEFFRQAHTTKIIWGSHKIIYIFTHSSGNITLYYDIELDSTIENNSIGGNAYPSTTIITKNKIYVPVPEPLVPTFKVEKGSKKFFIRYDEIFS